MRTDYQGHSNVLCNLHIAPSGGKSAVGNTFTITGMAGECATVKNQVNASSMRIQQPCS